MPAITIARSASDRILSKGKPSVPPAPGDRTCAALARSKLKQPGRKQMLRTKKKARDACAHGLG